MSHEKPNSNYLEGKRHIEDQLPLEIERDRTLRAKILDNCGMTCTFCHNEGTPVTSDNRALDKYIAGPGVSSRVSIFAENNGVDFLPGVMQADEDFVAALTALRDEFDLTELHLTGGEPSLHPNLSELIKMATEIGFDVRMTSNGENVFRVAEACAEAGLSKINFSIFGTTPQELAAVQAPKFNSEKLAARKLESLDRSIEAATELGIRADANVVIPDYSHRDRVFRLLDKYSGRVSLRLLNSLDDGEGSYEAIYRILDDLGATPRRKFLTVASSNSRVEYQLPLAESVFFKQLRDVRLPDTCMDCDFHHDGTCEEGFYGVRLYIDRDGQYRAGVCIQRMDLTTPIDYFMNESGLPREIHQLRISDSQVIGAVGVHGFYNTDQIS